MTPEAAIVTEFADLLIGAISDELGPEQIERIVGVAPKKTGFLGHGTDRAALALAALPPAELKEKTAKLIALLGSGLGGNFAEERLQDIYTRLERKHSPSLANTTILPLIPERYLGKFRLRLLSKEELEARDLELEKANAELRELDQRKSEFLSIAAHQMRTPLTGIKWTLDLLLKGQVGELSADQKDLLEKSYESNERMITLVGEMLRTNQIEAGMTLHRKEADVVALAQSILDELAIPARQQGVTIDLVEEGTIPLLPIDAELIRAVFQNLIENAVRYSTQGGAVHVRIRPTESGIECSVEDHGIGIPAGEQHSIFGRFYRAQNAVQDKPDGSGLGLFIAKSIVELHGGKISFMSAEGKGTTFVFTLPS